MTNWTRDEYLEMCRRTGRTPDQSVIPQPAGTREKAPRTSPDALEPEKGTHGTTETGNEAKARSRPSERTTHRITTGRCHRNLIRDPRWGNRALTGTEAAWLDAHEHEFAHIDLHPAITLAAGIRYVADFLAWTELGEPSLFEIKASEKLARATAIQRIAALCQDHPLGPLVITWTEDAGKTWRQLPLTQPPPRGTVEQP